MKQIDELNYVDTAEKVIQDLKQENRNKISLTTSKIRNLLSMTAALYTDAQKASRRQAIRRNTKPCAVFAYAGSLRSGA